MTCLPTMPGDFARWAIVLLVLLAGVYKIRQARRRRTTAHWRRESEAYRRAVMRHQAKQREGDRTWNS